MIEQITLLFSLHGEDQKIQELQAALEKMAPELAEQEALVRGHQKTLDEATAKLAEIEKSRRSKEGEVEMSEARLKDFQGKLSMIKTNKEYQAALKEIADTKKINKATEDQILELMKQIDAAKTENQGVETALKAASEIFEKKKEAFEAESTKIRQEIEKLLVEHNRIVTQIEPRWLAQYQKVTKSGKEGLSEVVGGTCHGCYMKIPPQLYIELQKMTAIHLCPSCNRILYMAGWLAPKEGSNSPKEVSRMKLKSLPKELFVEVLDYLADYEHLSGLNEVLDGEHTVLDVRSALRETALFFRKEIELEKEAKSLTDYRKDDRLSSSVRDLLSILSPGDERKLLLKFGLLDQ